MANKHDFTKQFTTGELLNRIAWFIDGLGHAANEPNAIAIVNPDGSVVGSAAPTGTQDVNLTQINGAAVSLGQALMAASVPVAIASDQGNIPIDIAANTLGVDFATETTLATMALESGGNLDTISSDTTSIDSKLAALGQALMAASMPVAIASDQSAIPINGSVNSAPTNIQIDSMDAATGWAAITGDTMLIGVDTSQKFEGTGSLRFVKTGGGTTVCGIEKTVSLDLSDLDLNELFFQLRMVPGTTYADVANVFVRIGTDASNYNRYNLPNPGLSNTWMPFVIPLWDESIYTQVGNGWDSSSTTTYIAVGFETNLAGDLSVGSWWVDDLRIVQAPAGSARQATLETVAGDTTSIDGKLAALGQALMAASMPVAIASDQSNLPVDIQANTIGLATQATLAGIAAQLPASLGAKTSAASLSITAATDTVLAKDASVTAMSAKLPATLGIKTAAASLSIAPASDAGMATSALQTSGNSSLTTIGTNTANLQSTHGASGATIPTRALSIGMMHETTLTTVATGQLVRGKATKSGIQLVKPEHPTSTTHAETFAAAQTDYKPANGKWNAPGAGKRLVIVGWHFSAAAAQTFSLQDEDDNELVGTIYVPANGNTGKEKTYIPLPTNKALELTTANAVGHSGTVSVITEQV